MGLSSEFRRHLNSIQADIDHIQTLNGLKPGQGFEVLRAMDGGDDMLLASLEEKTAQIGDEVIKKTATEADNILSSNINWLSTKGNKIKDHLKGLKSNVKRSDVSTLRGALQNLEQLKAELTTSMQKGYPQLITKYSGKRTREGKLIPNLITKQIGVNRKIIDEIDTLMGSIHEELQRHEKLSGKENVSPRQPLVKKQDARAQKFIEKVQSQASVGLKDLSSLEGKIQELRQEVEKDPENPNYKERRAQLEVAESELSHLKMVGNLVQIMRHPTFKSKFPNDQTIALYEALFVQNQRVLAAMVESLEKPLNLREKALADLFESDLFNNYIHGAALYLELQKGRQDHFDEHLLQVSKTMPDEVQAAARKCSGYPEVTIGQRIARYPLLLENLVKNLNPDERERRLSALLQNPALQSCIEP